MSGCSSAWWTRWPERRVDDGDRGEASVQILRGPGGTAGPVLYRRTGDHGRHGPLGVRQDHAAADPAGAGDGGQRHGGGPGGEAGLRRVPGGPAAGAPLRRGEPAVRAGPGLRRPGGPRPAGPAGPAGHGDTAGPGVLRRHEAAAGPGSGPAGAL